MDDAERRVEALVTELRQATATLVQLLPRASQSEPRPIGDAALPQLREAMLALAGFGLPGAISRTGFSEPERAALYAEAWALAHRAQQTLDRLAALAKRWGTEAVAPLTDEVRVERARACLSVVLGRGFPLLPRLSLSAASELQRAFASSGALLENDPARALAWLEQVAKVREPAATLDEVLTLSELLFDRTRVQPIVGQLPRAEGEAWIARNAPLDPSQGRLGLFAIDHGGLDALAAGRACTGLVVDSWTERIAATEQVAGVAVHFDAPSSRAPQALLVVVPPEGESWSFDLVVDSLLETLEAAKLRAVDPDALTAHGHQLPAIFAGALDAGLQPESA